MIAAAARLKSLMNGLKGRANANCTSKALHWIALPTYCAMVAFLPIMLPTHCIMVALWLLHYDFVYIVLKLHCIAAIYTSKALLNNNCTSNMLHYGCISLLHYACTSDTLLPIALSMHFYTIVALPTHCTMTSTGLHYMAALCLMHYYTMIAHPTHCCQLHFQCIFTQQLHFQRSAL